MYWYVNLLNKVYSEIHVNSNTSDSTVRFLVIDSLKDLNPCRVFVSEQQNYIFSWVYNEEHLELYRIRAICVSETDITFLCYIFLPFKKELFLSTSAIFHRRLFDCRAGR